MYTAKGLSLKIGMVYKCYKGDEISTWVCTKVPSNDFETVGVKIKEWEVTSPDLVQYTNAQLTTLVLGWSLTMQEVV